MAIIDRWRVPLITHYWWDEATLLLKLIECCYPCWVAFTQIHLLFELRPPLQKTTILESFGIPIQVYKPWQYSRSLKACWFETSIYLSHWTWAIDLNIREGTQNSRLRIYREPLLKANQKRSKFGWSSLSNERPKIRNREANLGERGVGRKEEPYIVIQKWRGKGPKRQLQAGRENRLRRRVW